MLQINEMEQMIKTDLDKQILDLYEKVNNKKVAEEKLTYIESNFWLTMDGVLKREHAYQLQKEEKELAEKKRLEEYGKS